MTETLAAIFDMDGVLVDTYHAHFESWLEMARGKGFDFTEEQFAGTFGRTSREVIAQLWGKTLGEEEIALLDATKEVAFRRLIEARVPLMPGAVELLHALRDGGFLLAVGSSAPPENVDLVLDRLRIRGLFAAVVNGKDVTRGKPDPQVFVTAGERLRIPPTRCVVIEDAALGIEAARAACMAAVGVASTGRTREELAAADLVVDSPAELSPQILRDVIAKQTRV